MNSSSETVARSHQLDGSAATMSDYYAQWTPEYDKDVENIGYQGPKIIADLFLSAAGRELDPERALAVMDAGCGTGLVGLQLREALAGGVIDGVDLSHEMVAEASRTGAYRHLTGGTDLNLGMREFSEHRYDAVVSCGVFLSAHVKPRGLEGLLRITRPGGLVVVSTRKRYLAETDFEVRVKTLVEDDRIELLERHRDLPYVADEDAEYWVMKTC